jgi:hypothetical protein
MGLLRNLFGNNRPSGSGSGPDPAKTSEMMDEDRFWKLVKDSLHSGEDQDDQEKYLIEQLALLPPADIIGFKLRMEKLLYDAYTSNMWCAAYIINGGCSDDGFEYFRCWLLSRGKEVYYRALNNPDSLVNEIDGEGEYEFEGFLYMAQSAFENKTGKDLYDFVDNDKFPFWESAHPPMVFTWKEDNPESIKAICPALFEQMGME